MEPEEYDIVGQDIAWCPGCGNFAIHNALKGALSRLGIDPVDLVIVSGIGQAAKMPQYVKCNMFNGLHGRAHPAAAGIKATNPRLIVIAESGDGDMYGEGGNHFIHAIRRNADITNIVHNNMVYGLTKGQASPTSSYGMRTQVQVDGVCEEPLNPLALAIAMDASFVARAYAGDIEKTTEIIMAAIKHKGFALIDIFQPCVTYNKINTYDWFREKCYYVEGHDPNDRVRAFQLALESDKLPLGIIYRSKEKKTFNECLACYADGDDRPLFERERNFDDINNLLDEGGV